MVKTTILFLALFAIGAVLVAQERPRMVGNPIYCNYLTVQPAFGPRGDIMRFVVGAEFSQLELKPSGDVEIMSIAKVTFDLLSGSDEDRRLAEMLEQRALKEYRETFPPPLDDRRRAIRSQ